MHSLKIKDVTEKIKEMDIYDAIEYLQELKETTSLNIDKLIIKATKKKEKYENAERSGDS